MRESLPRQGGSGCPSTRTEAQPTTPPRRAPVGALTGVALSGRRRRWVCSGRSCRERVSAPRTSAPGLVRGSCLLIPNAKPSDKPVGTSASTLASMARGHARQLPGGATETGGDYRVPPRTLPGPLLGNREHRVSPPKRILDAFLGVGIGQPLAVHHKKVFVPPWPEVEVAFPPAIA
jgi:hypothetical protein